MSMSVNSTSNALSYIQNLLQSMSSGVGGAASTDPLDNLSQLFSGSPANGSTNQSSTSNAFGPSPPPFSSGTMAALMALQGQAANGASGSGGAQGLFSQLDTDGDGSVSKTEFESALGQSGVDTSSADALFSKLDQNGDGSVSQSELSSAAHRGHGHGHGHHMEASGSGGGGDQGGLASLLNSTSANGASTQTESNSDGSSKTTITYADGSTVTMTTPAAEQNGGTSGDGTNGQTAGGSNSNNLIQQLIRLQAQLVSQQGASVSAVA
jgi:EF-hand domain pair